MVNWIEIGLFLYALAGSATTGYWFLVSFNPGFREREKNTKLGYSVIAGLMYTGAIFFASILLISGNYNNRNFLEIFFGVIPVSFAALALTAAGKRVRLLVERAQHGEQEPQQEPEKLGTSILTAQTIGTQKNPSLEPAAESNSPRIPETSEPIEHGTAWESEETTEERFSEEELEPIEEPIEEPGETEKDVVEAIRKIMKGEKAENEKKGEKMSRMPAGEPEEKEEIRKIMGTIPGETEQEPLSALFPSALSSEMSPGDIEKIKADLKKRILAKEAAETMQEELKKKETGKK